ncbi:class A sortase [Lacticaseibacillus hulanensis]|uniref:class A sortase n=1 Tax=Lacticaseibacillus hulanensis TaxID=2493111 RepID=UPI000FDC94EE|nr:class A sortase [Lacticaseibacillus hulanensis]
MRKERKKKNGKVWLWRVLLILLLIVSLGLIFNEQIKLFVVDHMSQNSLNTAQQLTADDVANNKKNVKKANYTFKSVESLDLSVVSKAALNRNLKPIGLMAVPSVNVHLPILAGIANTNLVVGAGTMKPDQVMGKRNYALAGHHIPHTKVLFTPLENAKLGEKIYLTDMKQIYTYTISLDKVVDKSQVQYINDVPGKTMVTLITCASQMEGQPERRVIQGDLTSTKKANKKQLTKIFGAKVTKKVKK